MTDVTPFPIIISSCDNLTDHLSLQLDCHACWSSRCATTGLSLGCFRCDVCVCVSFWVGISNKEAVAPSSDAFRPTSIQFI